MPPSSSALWQPVPCARQHFEVLVPEALEVFLATLMAAHALSFKLSVPKTSPYEACRPYEPKNETSNQDFRSVMSETAKP